MQPNPDHLLEIARAQPSQFGVESYRETISELRRKGNSWRQIADFLIEKGVKTDHTRIYRLMMEENPLYDHNDGPVNLGGLFYESQIGTPLQPYLDGLDVFIKERVRFLLIEDPEQGSSIWCQAQFQLSARPNRIWVKHLHSLLHAEFKPSRPFHLSSKRGFDLKFSGDVMAVDCYVFNLKQNYSDIYKAMVETSQHLLKDSSLPKRLGKLREERDRRIAKCYFAGSGQSQDGLIDEHNEFYHEQHKRYQADFDSLSLDPPFPSSSFTGKTNL